MFSVVAAFYLHNWYIISKSRLITQSSESNEFRMTPYLENVIDYVVGVILHQGNFMV